MIGIDLAGPEQHTLELGPRWSASTRICSSARATAGLSATVHTGETTDTGAEGVLAVIEQAQAAPHRPRHRAPRTTRRRCKLVGSGTRAGALPDARTCARARCDGLDELEHIVRTFCDRGVKFTINTDGPYLLETDMRREIELVEKNGILTPEQVDQTLAWARQYSFIPG